MLDKLRIWFARKRLQAGPWSKLPLCVLNVLIFVCQPLSLKAEEVDPAERARKSAKEGLQAALDELQQAAGPDQRVTARASILDGNILRPHLTGVWQSWEIDPNNPPAVGDYSPGRESRFLKWLVSNQDGEAMVRINFPDVAPVDSVQLLGAGTMGPSEPDSRDFVRGGKVPANDPNGSYAWAVLDEGVKARINTPYQKEIDGVAEGTIELGSGERPRTDFISGLSNLEPTWFEIDSPVFKDLADAFDAADFTSKLEGYFPGITSQLKPLTHDVSCYSMGLFCNVAGGGLKRDFHLMTGTDELPEEYANKRVYESQLDLLGEPSDPYWQYLADFAKLRAESGVGSEIPSVPASVSGYTPYSTDPSMRAAIGQPQGGAKLLPTMVRLQFIFSLHAEAITEADRESGEVAISDTHRLNLTYQPVLTLHNPYNVALRFDELKIAFRDLPFAVEFKVTDRNGEVETTPLIPFDLISRSFFELNIKTNSIGGLLQPGEVRVFTANVDFEEDATNGLKQIEMVPGFDPLGGTYRLEKLIPGTGYRYIDFNQNDTINLGVAPRAHPTFSGNRFVVTMGLSDGQKAGVIEMDYQTPSGIEDAIEAVDGNLIYPLGPGTLIDGLRGLQIISASSAGERVAFAEFGFSARDTSLSEFVSGSIPKSYPGKPWSYAHASTGVGKHDFSASHPGDHSHEFALRRIHSVEDSSIQVQPASGRGYFMSGNTAEYGVTFGALYDVPLAPILSFSSLNGADPTGVSGYLPRVAQPVGNSWANPLITGDKLREPTLAQNSDYLDHSFLLNLALYDQFYFSGLAAQDDDWFDTPKTLSDLVKDFSEGNPLDDPRLLLYRPDGQRAADFVEMIASDPEQEAYRKVPAWQMMKGAFNVNSTSVEAWKAMLASVQDDIAVYTDQDMSQIKRLEGKADDEVRISRFRLPGSESYQDDMKSRAYWLGPREYSEQDISTLAENIVTQVRERGPFLSMGDFVNRQLISTNTDRALCGALQRAIDLSGINRDLAISAGAGRDITQAAISDNPYYKFPEAAAGVSYQGAPGCLSQADLLTVLGNAATVRSDTFTIRAYGESRDASGQLLEAAWCEAVVQRVPDWVDPADKAEVAPDQLTSESNRELGRKFRVIAFRWLQPDEV